MNAKQTATTSSSSTPWGPQASALTSAFDNAKTAYGTASGAVAPNNFTAGMTPQQIATFQQMIGYGGNTAAPGAETATGANLLGAGSAGATGALDKLGAFNPGTLNNPQNTIDAATQYATGANQYVPAAVRNAMQSGIETARDVTLPGMESSAAGSGNINSSRTGLAEGLVQRGLAEQAGNLTGTMEGDNYRTGLGIASSANATNNAQTLQALTGSGALGAQLGGQGAGMVGSGINDTGNLFNIAGSGGAGLQGADQANLTNQLQQYQSKVSSPYDALNGLMGIIGSNNWGSNTTGTQTTTPSAFSVIGGLMNSVGSLMMPFKMSDGDMKEDIAQIGTTFDGIPIYRYRYIGRRRFEIGFIAQDIEKVIPDAVRAVEGIKFVDYGEATKHLV